MTQTQSEWCFRTGVALAVTFGTPLLEDHFPEWTHKIAWVGGFICALALFGWRGRVPKAAA